MNRSGFLYSKLLVASLLAVLGCQRESANDLTPKVAQLEKDVAEIKALMAKGIGAPRAERKRPDPNTVYKVAVNEGDFVRGSKQAKVTLVQGYEFACPFCRDMAPLMESVLEKYSKDVAVVSKMYVVHPDIATLPAQAMCAADKQGKFADYEVALWKQAWPAPAEAAPGTRPRLVPEKLGQSALVDLAKAQGLDPAKFTTDLTSAECKERVSKQQRELAAIGVSATPALYLNGKPYAGPRTVEGLSAAIEIEIKKADEALAKGGSLENYYASIIANGKTAL